MITQKNPPISLDPTPTGLDPGELFPCPWEARVSPDAEKARRHTLGWLTRFGIITGERQRGYVDAMRLDLYAARVAPYLRGAELELFCNWIVFTTQLDDHLSTDQPSTIAPLVHDLVAVLDHDDPHCLPAAPGPFLRAWADLWKRCQHIPQPWRRQLADLWAQWAEAYLTEARLRAGRLWPSIDRQRQLVRITSAALPFPRLSDHLAGLHVPDRLLNSHHVTGMRMLVPDHTMAVNDVYSADREAAEGDHLNAVFITEHEWGCSREEAVRAVADRARETLQHYQHLESSLFLAAQALDATSAEQDQLTDMARHLRHWFSGNLAWHQHDTHRYATGIQQLATPHAL
ncbi:terpene synthase family protein [Streptomyces klenkii]